MYNRLNMTVYLIILGTMTENWSLGRYEEISNLLMEVRIVVRHRLKSSICFLTNSIGTTRGYDPLRPSESQEGNLSVNFTFNCYSFCYHWLVDGGRDEVSQLIRKTFSLLKKVRWLRYWMITMRSLFLLKCVEGFYGS